MSRGTKLWAGALALLVVLAAVGVVTLDREVVGMATGTDGFQVVAVEDGCVVSVGVAGPSGVPPLRAECRWSDTTVEEVHAVFSNLDRWQDFVWCIADSRIVRTEGDRALVWQRQSVRGINDRENEVWMSIEDHGDGYTYDWQLSDDPFEADGAVVPTENEGAWSVRRSPDGGVVLTNWIRYDPAGSVPAWLVRWFQTRGALQILADVHDAVTG